MPPFPHLETLDLVIHLGTWGKEGTKLINLHLLYHYIYYFLTF
jgi:hypothetical protein